jgi:hypothetical protein
MLAEKSMLLESEDKIRRDLFDLLKVTYSGKIFILPQVSYMEFMLDLSLDCFRVTDDGSSHY